MGPQPVASAGPWGYLRRLRSFASGVWGFWIRDAKTVRMVRFVRSTFFEVRPRPGRAAGVPGTKPLSPRRRLTFAPRLAWFPLRLSISAPFCPPLRSAAPSSPCGLLSHQDEYSRTPLHWAVNAIGKAELIPILLAAGADVNAKASACASLPRCPPSGWRPANAALRRASGGSGSTVAINRGASSWVPRRWRGQIRGAISVD